MMFMTMMMIESGVISDDKHIHRYRLCNNLSLMMAMMMVLKCQQQKKIVIDRKLFE